MPENCWDCSGRIVGDIQTFNEAVSMLGGKCPYMERIVNPKEFNMHSGRHPDCPIVELPPYGDLIDRDNLLEKAFYDYNETTHDYNRFRVVFEDDIIDAPVVIEGSL